jgi:hypothetical protein
MSAFDDNFVHETCPQCEGQGQIPKIGFDDMATLSKTFGGSALTVKMEPSVDYVTASQLPVKLMGNATQR